MSKDQEKDDKKKSDYGEKGGLVIGHNMCTATIGLEPKNHGSYGNRPAYSI